jgi:hypothetical protein
MASDRPIKFQADPVKWGGGAGNTEIRAPEGQPGPGTIFQ